VKRFEIRSLEDVQKALDSMRQSLSPEDLGAGKLRTEAPTSDSLDKGRFALAEISGAPRLYYRALDGTIYEFIGTPA